MNSFSYFVVNGRLTVWIMCTGLLYFPMATFVFEWFSEKKGLVSSLANGLCACLTFWDQANGVIFSGTGM